MIARGSVLFLDTNVLLAATDRSRSEHGDCVALLDKAAPAGCHLACTPQIIREYLVVATRPVAANGLGLGVADTLANVRQTSSRVTFLEESREVARRLLELVGEHALAGKQIHDANIVASMKVHGVETLVTSNTGDFAGLHGGQLLAPAEAVRELGRRDES